MRRGAPFIQRVFERSECFDFALAALACAYGPGGLLAPTPDIAFKKT
jgi:hypothetical protein